VKRDVILFVGLLIISMFLFLAVYGLNQAGAESDGYFVLCDPTSYVNARIQPKKAAEIAGRYECGDFVETDGKERNGFVHIVNCSFEYTDAWVSKRYLVKSEPIISETVATIRAKGRVAARRWVNGKRKSWMKPGTTITVYAMSEEWSVTSRGFVQTRYLEVQN